MNLDRSFPQHPLPKPTDEVLNTASALREGCRNLANLINDVLPDSREKSLALTHLEDASTYAVKAAYADKVETVAVRDPASYSGATQ